MTEQTPAARILQQYAEALRPVHEHLQRAATEMVRHFDEFAKTPSGQTLLALAKLKESDPDRYERIMAAHHADLRRPYCNCLCRRWDHAGICEGKAVTEIPMRSEATGRVQVAMCRACADSVVAASV